MIDEAAAGELRRQWDEGWNQGDVDTIMAPFAADVVFRSPFVGRMTDSPGAGTVAGHDALRAYVVDALRRAPGIRYTVDATYAGVDGVVLVYTVHRPDGTDQAGADTLRLDADGKVTEWCCHYSFAFLGALGVGVG